MPTVLLMDDTVNRHGHMAFGCQLGLEKRGLNCEFEGGRDAQNTLLRTPEELGDRLRQRVVDEAADAVVLDIVWGEANDWDGFSIWNCSGLKLDKKMVVFLTQHRSFSQLDELAKQHGFSRQQVQYKNAQGLDAAVRWLCDQFGIPF